MGRNDLVNFASTAFAVGVAMVEGWLLGRWALR